MRLHVLRSVVPLAALAAAGCGYRGGSFHGPRGPFPGERVTVGCLDVALAAVHRAEADGPVIAYEFGNRCDHAARVDLASIVARGRTDRGEEVTLAPYDPDAELRPARLEARTTGREVVEYRARTHDALTMVCVDLWGIDGAGRERVERCLHLPDAVGPSRVAVGEVAP